MKENKSVAEALGENAAVLLLVFHEKYSVKNARLLVRVGHESSKHGGVVFTTVFREENNIIRLPLCCRYAIPVRLNAGYKTTFVEVLDTNTDTSCVFAGRHGEYVNPYGVKKSKEVVLEVTIPSAKEPASVHEEEKEADTHVLEFVSSVMKLADVTGKHYETPQRENEGEIYVTEEREQELPVDPILELESQYESCQPVFLENVESKMITGVYWCNERHWKMCNTELFTAPLSDSLYPINAAWSMPILLRQLHMCFIESIETNVMYNYVLPHDVSDRVNFPHLPLIDATILNDLYTGIVREVIEALTLIYRDIPFPTLNVNFTDFADSSVLISREGLYGTSGLDVSRNPFNPWTNSFFCKRWGLEEYINYRLHLGKTLLSVTKTRTPWCKFIVRNGLIESVQHATGQTYGDTVYDQTPLQTLRIQLNKLTEASWIESELNEITSNSVQTSIDEMILRGLGQHPAIVCYANVNDGHVYVSHPLFPPGKCAVLSPTLPSLSEMELLIKQVKYASESLYRYYVMKM